MYTHRPIKLIVIFFSFVFEHNYAALTMVVTSPTHLSSNICAIFEETHISTILYRHDQMKKSYTKI